MEKQEVKIEYKGKKVFFFEHSFKSAYEHAIDFVNRNINKYDMDLYILNDSYIGLKWILYKSYKKED